MDNDKELVDQILEGNIKAFKVLISNNERIVLHMVHRLIQNNEDVQDVAQEVFIKVYKNIGNFKFQSKISTWIAQIAYSTSINHLKKFSDKAKLTDSIDDFEHFHQTYENPESLLEKKNKTEFIHSEIEKLPIKYRTVLTLYHLNEFSYEEIEKITGMPEGTVKNYLFRARKILKEKLESNFKFI